MRRPGGPEIGEAAVLLPDWRDGRGRPLLTASPHGETNHDAATVAERPAPFCPAPGDAVLVVDVFNDFEHDGGAELLDSFRARASNMQRAINTARRDGVPLIYVNDERGRWTSDACQLRRRALAGRGAGLIEPLQPRDGEPFILKHRHSAFDHTPLVLLLDSIHAERIVLVGAATEGCVVQTAIDARELGLKASILVDACATTDPELEAVALRYAERVGGIHLEWVVRSAPRRT